VLHCSTKTCHAVRASGTLRVRFSSMNPISGGCWTDLPLHIGPALRVRPRKNVSPGSRRPQDRACYRR
jgi:hypothetical protein